MTDILNVFIGYDSREPEAWEVARSSLLRHATGPVHVQPLKDRALCHAGLYTRAWRTEGAQKVDAVDGKPFSTDFSFTRFLVPALCQWEGWAIFVDCDFLFMADLTRIQEEFDPDYAVMVCKQDYRPTQDVKMDGQVQSRYWRKNWSSLIAFNCGHPSNKMLTVQAVNERPGSWLHGFSWLEDREIGDLDHRWNWLAGTTQGEPLAVHYSMGGPWFAHCQDVAYAKEWLAEADRIGVLKAKAA